MSSPRKPFSFRSVHSIVTHSSLKYNHFLQNEPLLNMNLTLLSILTLAATAFAGPMFSEDDIRAHLAQISAPINKREEISHGFAQQRQNRPGI